MPMNEAFLNELDYEGATTRRVLERVPENRMAWTPHPTSMTMGQLSAHIAEMLGFVPATMATPFFDMAAAGPRQPTEFKTRKELLDAFDANLKKARAAIASASDEALREKWALRSGEQVFFELPRTGVLRTMILNHIVHHRGQLSVYLRMNGVPVPSIYGPSADEESPGKPIQSK